MNKHTTPFPDGVFLCLLHLLSSQRNFAQIYKEMTMKKYLESELPQGSQEWLDLRKSHITATMASVIAGSNPFQTPDKLWKEMLGFIPRQPSNFAMERGRRLEPVARNLYEKLQGTTFAPLCVVNEEELDPDGSPWIMASLDGMGVFEDKAVEIKCPGINTHSAAISGAVPGYYQDQIQWQFLASENRFSSIDYVSYHPDVAENERLVVVPVLPDHSRQKELMAAAATFRECLKLRIPPCGSEFETAARHFIVASKEAEVIQSRLEKAKDMLILASGGKSQSGGGVIISVTERKKPADMKALCAILFKEFNVPEERVEELKAELAGASTVVTTVKLASDADKVYQSVIKEREISAQADFSSVSGTAVEVSAVSPIW